MLINSGCANACTGDRGMKDSLISARCLASHLNMDPSGILVASTGVIGSFLPVPKLVKGISAAVSSLNSKGGTAAAQAIMTTEAELRGRRFESEGWPKGPE